ncbi:MAG: nucleotidyltransferase family protein [Candidatus Cloacimonetes bacterium]|nr:nucleotidyltransferase family protein [Candidatus Cloacimonadota bacterium]
MIEQYLITDELNIKQAIKRINEATSKIVFVIDSKNKLIGSVSDGDIRRAILNNISFEQPLGKIINRNTKTLNQNYSLEEAKELMLLNKIEVIPIIDSENNIMDILFWSKIFKGKHSKEFSQIDLPVVIMAGGKGTRMDPFTRILPKPLIPIGDKAMIEVIMDEYAKFGMKNFFISINHKGNMIKAFFDDHESDYSFKYINEDKPLGTAGAIKFLEGKINSPFFVSNCDIIIKDDYSKIYDFHKKGNYSLTMVASMQNYIIPYGVCEIENGGDLKSITEKPQYDFLVNTGMYILNLDVIKYIPENKVFHITHLIERLKEEGLKIGVYPVSEDSYIDVGQWKEYKQAIKKLV